MEEDDFSDEESIEVLKMVHSRTLQTNLRLLAFAILIGIATLQLDFDTSLAERVVRFTTVLVILFLVRREIKKTPDLKAIEERVRALDNQ